MNERECRDEKMKGLEPIEPPESGIDESMIDLGRVSEETHGSTGNRFEGLWPRP